MTALWAPTEDGRERLLLVRLVRIEDKEVCQGIVLDDAALARLLADKVADLFPQAQLTPVHETEPPRPDRTMTALPLQLDPGPADPPPGPGWTPLRVGLALAWAAALVALLAVGLGGWSLLDLSERRIRFVSAVTHELRTPLTTLRLYLDMLTNGLVRDEKQREEYIQTLNAEANRLSRLVGNVLDYSRLENAAAAAQPGARFGGRAAGAGRGGLAKPLPDRRQGAGDRGGARGLSGRLHGRRAGAANPRQPGGQRLQVQPAARRTAASGCASTGSGAASISRWRTAGRAWRRATAARSSGPSAAAAAPSGDDRRRRPGAGAGRSWARLLGGELTLRPTAAGACFRLSLPADVRPPCPPPIS